ncbi:MAG TPA: (Fe-S)-binding protein, partial [Bacillota bacterium]|nr:(Fe-S)-binding protein [Bacillota bacterium]
CQGGCIGGPGMNESMSIAARRTQLCQLAANQESGISPNMTIMKMDLHRKHHYTGKAPVLPEEKEIRRILALTGKNTPEDETNCGGCGYSSCREKAIAVFQGLAEPEMCIPYMKNKAESFSNTIVETTLNAIIVVDEELRVQKFNPAAIRMFKMLPKEAEGKALNLYLDPTDFRTVLELQKTFVGIRSYPQLGLTTRQTIYALPKYKAVIGIITDITAEEARKEKFDELRRAALERASRVIHEQMQTAQEIAGLLGESTAETKATLLELIDIMEGESGDGF